MSEVYAFREGPGPLVVSVPHDGRRVPDELAFRMTPDGLDLPDTDWHVAELYDFVRELGASMLVAKLSRYVVDLNRPPDDEDLYPGQLSTGLCPQRTFAGDAIYRPGEAIDAAERKARREAYWRPYHDRLATALAAVRERHGYALLWDAHSIPSRVPTLFDGVLPVLNVGTFDGRSADPAIAEAVTAVATASRYETVRDGRFKGGYITRHYGDPGNGVHAIQLEIAQRAYMDEESRELDEARAGSLRDTIRAMLEEYLRAASRKHGGGS